MLVTSPGTGFNTSYTGSYNLGYQFTVGSSALSVTSLGFYDYSAGSFSFEGPGLGGIHPVGLWTTSGTLLASVVIPSGISPLKNSFVFQSLGTPVVLSATTDYVLSAFWSSNADKVIANFTSSANPSFAADVTLVGSRNIPGSSPSFAFPSNGGTANGFSWIGPNMEYTVVPEAVVPEPSTYAALLAGAASLAALVGKRKRRQTESRTRAGSPQG